MSFSVFPQHKDAPGEHVRKQQCGESEYCPFILPFPQTPPNVVPRAVRCNGSRIASEGQRRNALSRLALIVASLAVGAVLAVGAAFTTSGVLSTPPNPPNKQLYNYGTP